MHTSTLLLLVACPLAWVLLDVLRKKLAAHSRAVPISFVLALAQVPPFLIWVLLAPGADMPTRGYWPPALASMVLNVVANLAFMRSVRLAPLSLTIPLLSLTPVFTTLLAIPLLGEVPAWHQGLGVLVVVAGSLVLAWDGYDTGARGRDHVRGVRAMALVALCWSVTSPLDKLALAHGGVAVHALVLSLGVALTLAVVLGHQRRFGEVRALRPVTGWVLAAGLCSVGAILLQLRAIELVWVGLVETLKRGLGSFMALLLGRLLFAERLHPRRIGAVLVMAVGVWLILAGSRG